MNEIKTAVQLLDDIIADLDMRARAKGDIQNGQVVLDLSNGLVHQYYAFKETLTTSADSTQDEREETLGELMAASGLLIFVGEADLAHMMAVARFAKLVRDKTMKARTSLASNLQAGDPVAWMVKFEARLGGARVTDRLIIWRKEDAKNHVREELIESVEPLYTAPPSQQAGKDAEPHNRYCATCEQIVDAPCSSVDCSTPERPWPRMTPIEQALDHAKQWPKSEEVQMFYDDLFTYAASLKADAAMQASPAQVEAQQSKGERE